MTQGHRWLSFPRALEEQFQTDRAQARRRQLLYTSMIGTALYMSFAWTDPLVLPDVTELLWRSRAVVMPVLVLAMVLSWLTSRPALREALTAAGTLLMALSTSWTIGHSHAPTAAGHVAILSLIPMFVGITARMPFLHTLAISTCTVLGAIVFVRGEGVTETLILRDSIMTVSSAAVFTLLANYGLDYRERSRYLLGVREIQQRQALVIRNRDLRLVLDNVDQALLTIDAAGVLADERSRMADEWFGSYGPSSPFVDYIAASDPDFAGRFQVGYEALLEEILPRDLCIAQLPSRLRCKERTFRCSYQPLAQEEARQAGLLIVIADVTRQLRHAEEEAAQSELAAILRGLMRDRAGLFIFLEEGGELVEALAGDAIDEISMRRLLHTLKGNAAIFGLNALSSICHEAEEQLALGELPGEPLRRLGDRWRTTAETIQAFTGSDQEGVGDISVDDIDGLAARVRSGLSTEEVVEELAGWKFEPIERGIRRLTQHAAMLARRLGKGDLEVDVNAPAGLRLDPRLWNPLCSALVHVVRNAVDHGLETPAQRMAAGKSPRPRLSASVSANGGAFTIEIADDGCGIDWAGVRALAEARELPGETRADLVEALLSRGFSTRAAVTATSGRGVGLSAVAHEVRRLGGEIDVVSEPGQGTAWRMTFPLPFAAIAAAA